MVLSATNIADQPLSCGLWHIWVSKPLFLLVWWFYTTTINALKKVKRLYVRTRIFLASNEPDIGQCWQPFFVSPRTSCSRRQQAWLFRLEKQSPLTYPFHINPYQCGCAVCATVFFESEPRVTVARNPIFTKHGHYCWYDWCHFWLMYVYLRHFMVKWRFHGELFNSGNWCRGLLMISVWCQH